MHRSHFITCYLEGEAPTNPTCFRIFMGLMKIFIAGWPENTLEVPEILQAHFRFHDELPLQDQLAFKGQRLVNYTCGDVQGTQIGMESCLRRARKIMFWPCKVSELRAYTAKCDACTKYWNHSSHMMWRPNHEPKSELTYATYKGAST